MVGSGCLNMKRLYQLTSAKSEITVIQFQLRRLYRPNSFPDDLYRQPMSPMLQYHPMFLRNTIDIVPQYEQQQQQQHQQQRRRPYALQLTQPKRPSRLGSLQSIIAAFKEQKHEYC